mmetsp:Transcript_1918/g.6623  ORF Transcript_1918/g.6623 Transcript_1918/m.6623 type:complete len:203 (+) Transcript_1918:622-1230(+)
MRVYLVALGAGLIVDAVEAHHGAQEVEQHGVARRVQRHLEEGREDVVEHLAEVAELARALVHVEEARNLHQPANVGVHEAVHVEPPRKLVPLRALATVDGHAPLYELVLAHLEVVDHLLGHLGNVAPGDEVVRLEEDLAQAALACGVVLEVELVEAVEGVVGVHVQRVDGQIVRRQTQRLEHLPQGHEAPVAEHHHFVSMTL